MQCQAHPGTCTDPRSYCVEQSRCGAHYEEQDLFTDERLQELRWTLPHQTGLD